MQPKTPDPVVTQSFLKKELKRFATKEDLTGLATKKDLEPFATKVFVDMAIDDLREDIEKQMAQLRSDLMEKLGEQLTNHEQRISRLEAKTT